MSHGVVVVYAPHHRTYSGRHERAVRMELAKRLALIKGYRFAGEYDPSAHYPGPVYFVASDTLVGIDAARVLGIQGEHDLFGGVVPHSFVCTKAITHPLIGRDAAAPEGWSHDFHPRVADVVLSGHTVFTPDDARRAAVRLLRHGPVRLKPTLETGGQGQIVIADGATLEAALAAINPTRLSTDGLVLEENLSDVVTYSVGQVRVGEHVATYHGLQKLTPNNSGTLVYGGSDLVIVRGGFDALLHLSLPEGTRLAVAQARIYDEAVARSFPGFFASRRNYDVARGRNAAGEWRSGVLEQSWRVGGASGAEIAALEAFRADPALKAVRASTIEVYGEVAAPPPHAIVYFHEKDEEVGFISKYTLIEPQEAPVKANDDP